ncbi:MAG: hypothetical protein Q7J26_05665 [Brevundimonas sp.]|uniref:hypothetical protein n=1 Tax=Brevundimonas sp. TaxID=1871086 RepID=UPI002721E578|nr:hypothetical protein [Brevundimonas sp.]MDO9607990.1 hypothetical protein [Brevundimonas sp.]
MHSMAFGPTCPECDTRVPFLKTQFRLGSAFACTNCGKELVVPKSQALFLGFGMIAIFLLAESRFPSQWGGMLGLLAIMILVGLPLSWAVTRVKAL